MLKLLENDIGLFNCTHMKSTRFAVSNSPAFILVGFSRALLSNTPWHCVTASEKQNAGCQTLLNVLLHLLIKCSFTTNTKLRVVQDIQNF